MQSAIRRAVDGIILRTALQDELDFEQEAPMLSQYLTRSALFALVCGVSSSAHGAVAYDESVSGDLSNSGLAPTLVSLSLGSNSILGSTGFQGATIDRDYFSITVPSGAALSSITVSPGTSVGGSVSFIGVQAGPVVNTFSAVGLLGWTHYSNGDINGDILPRMGIPSLGSTGFTAPLGPGTYSFWVQDFDSGPVSYGFDLKLTAAVPEPETYAALAVGLAFLIAGLRRRGAY
jgi:hypothetical protein